MNEKDTTHSPRTFLDRLRYWSGPILFGILFTLVVALSAASDADKGQKLIKNYRQKVSLTIANTKKLFVGRKMQVSQPEYLNGEILQLVGRDIWTDIENGFFVYEYDVDIPADMFGTKMRDLEKLGRTQFVGSCNQLADILKGFVIVYRYFAKGTNTEFHFQFSSIDCPNIIMRDPFAVKGRPHVRKALQFAIDKLGSADKLP